MNWIEGDFDILIAKHSLWKEYNYEVEFTIVEDIVSERDTIYRLNLFDNSTHEGVEIARSKDINELKNLAEHINNISVRLKNELEQ